MDKTKRNRQLLIVSMIIIHAYIYTYTTSLILAKSYDTIYYHWNSGLSMGVLGCFALFLVSKIDKLIDNRIGKTSKFSFVISLFLSFFVSIFTCVCIGWLLEIIIRGNWNINFRYFREQLVVVNYLAILLPAYYSITYFSKSIAIRNKKLRAENNELSKALHKYTSKLTSYTNNRTILIDVEDVNFLRIEEGVIFAITNQGKKHPLSTTTLKNLESKLNPAFFFRINRSEIIHIDKIEYFEPYVKDRLAITLSNCEETLYTSNKRTVLFREWLSQAS